jgi:replication factor C subunit 1
MNHPVPFMRATNVVAPKKMAKEMPDLEEAIEEEDDADLIDVPEADDDELDLKKDKYIKQAKPKKAPKKKAKADDDEDEDVKPKGRGKAKAKAKK